MFNGGSGRTRNRQHGFLLDTRVTRLVESDDIHVVGGILLDDTLGVIIGIERVHEDEGDADIVLLVQVLEAMQTCQYAET